MGIGSKTRKQKISQMKPKELKYCDLNLSSESKFNAVSTLPELHLNLEIPGPGRPQTLTPGISA